MTPCASHKHTGITFKLNIRVFLIEDKTDFFLLKCTLYIIWLKYVESVLELKYIFAFLRKENVLLSQLKSELRLPRTTSYTENGSINTILLGQDVSRPYFQSEVYLSIMQDF